MKKLIKLHKKTYSEIKEEFNTKEKLILPKSDFYTILNNSTQIIKSKNEELFLKEKVKINTNKKEIIAVFNGELENDTIVYEAEKNIKTNSIKDEIIPDEKADKITQKNILDIQIDSIKSKKINKVQDVGLIKLDTIKTIPKLTLPQKRKSNFNFILQLSCEQLYVNKNNLLTNLSANKSAANIQGNTYTTSTQAGSGVRPSISNSNIYFKGKTFGLSFFVTKTAKKRFSTSIGFNFKYNEYSLNAYNAMPLQITYVNNSLNSDSNGINPNSFYSIGANRSSSPNKINLKNKFYNVGLIGGINYNLLKLKSKGSMHIQTQIATDLSFNNTIYLLNNVNGRLFMDKNLTTKFNIYQNFSLLYFNKNNNYSVGPVYSFMYNKINKDIVNLGLINTSSFGVQFQYFFKENKKK